MYLDYACEQYDVDKESVTHKVLKDVECVHSPGVDLIEYLQIAQDTDLVNGESNQFVASGSHPIKVKMLSRYRQGNVHIHLTENKGIENHGSKLLPPNWEIGESRVCNVYTLRDDNWF